MLCINSRICQQNQMSLITLGYNMFSHENPKILPYLNKFYIHELLNHYSQIMFIDSDIRIKKEAPNLFEIAGSKLMMLDEGGLYKNVDQRKEFWSNIRTLSKNEKIQINTGWYFNTGVIVCSKDHQELFNPQKFIYVGVYPEQDFLNYRVALESITVDALPMEFNMLMCGDKNEPFSKNSAYFLHYAGASKWKYFKEYHFLHYQKVKFFNSLKKRVSFLNRKK
jgi:lipopolysaccharide biosynthesis glycosyltransferase